MASRDKDQAAPHHHQPLLSSLVVRPSNSDGGGGGGGSGGRGGDYESGEVNRDPPPYSRSDRYSDEPDGFSLTTWKDAFQSRYRIRAGSASPVHRRDADRRYSSDYNHLSRSRGYGGGRDPGRYRDPSPPYSRGRVGGGRTIGRTFNGPGFGPGPSRGEGISRNNPNVRPREGDWICPDPACGNLNFARREYCNNCNRVRPPPVGSPRRGYAGPPPFHAPRRFPGPPMDRSPERTMNGYRSSPRGLARDGPREYGSAVLPPPRHEGRFPDHHARRDRLDYMEDGFRGRNKFDRPPPLDWGHRDRVRDGFSNERKGFERRPLSPTAPLPPSLPPHRGGGGGRWARDVRERSRSPLRGGPPPKDYRRDMYMDRARDDRRGAARDRIGGGMY